MRLLVAALLAVLSTTACGGSSTAQEPTAASVAVQPGDLPRGMVRCDLTGDIDSFISREQPSDPATSKTMASDWQTAKRNGATAAYAAVYTDSDAHCAEIKGSGTDPGAATYRLVVNFVIQFKDEKTATTGYKSDNTIFGFSASQLRESAGTGAVVEGTKSGLTADSITLTQTAGDQTFYIAVWQNGSFMVILAVLNVDPVASKKVATSENGRIK